MKKGLLSRTVGKLRTVVSRGADAQADSVDAARLRARQLFDTIDDINIKMEEILLENDLAYDDESIASERLQDVEKNIAELSNKESEIDEVYGAWLRAQRHDVDTNAAVAAKTLEALTILTDRLTSQARPSIRTTGMSPPKWDGQVKNFCSWRCQFRQYMKSAGITKDEDELMFVLHTSVLPPRVTSTIESCTTMCGPNGVWERLQEKIPKAAVIREIISEMEAIRPIREKTASEMRAVLDRLTDFARRITEVGKYTELTSATVIHIVSRKLHPDLYYEFERWMRHDFPTEELSVTRIIEFLRAETEARETISPGAKKSELPRPSVHNVTGAQYTDPCPLGCGVHHKFIDCPAFRQQQPWQRRKTIDTAGRCYNCFCRHRTTECQKPNQCRECGSRHHQLLNCITTRRVSSTPSTQHTSTATTMNPSSASFTPQLRSTNSATPTRGFLGHVFCQKDNPRFSPTTYVEISDANGVWHRIVAFFDTGSDTTLIKSSLARRLGLAGTRELFHYGVAGGGSKTENSTRYTLQVRPVHIRESIAYAVEAMGINRPAHDAPAIDETVFDEFQYLKTAQGYIPVGGASIDLLVGYDHAYLINALHTISTSTDSDDEHPSAAFSRLGWTLFGGMTRQPRPVIRNRAEINHVQRFVALHRHSHARRHRRSHARRHRRSHARRHRRSHSRRHRHSLAPRSRSSHARRPAPPFSRASPPPFSRESPPPFSRESPPPFSRSPQPPFSRVSPAPCFLARLRRSFAPASAVLSPAAAVLSIVASAVLSFAAAVLSIIASAVLSPAAAVLSIVASAVLSPAAAVLSIIASAVLSPAAAVLSIVASAVLSPATAVLSIVAAVFVSIAAAVASVVAADVSVDAADVSVDAADVSVDAADVSVAAADVSVAAADVSVVPADVSVDAADVSVDAADVSVDAADVSVAAADVSVAAPVISAVDVSIADVSIAADAVSPVAVPPGGSPTSDGRAICLSRKPVCCSEEHYELAENCLLYRK